MQKIYMNMCWKLSLNIYGKSRLSSTVNSYLKIGKISSWVLSFTFFLSNFLWAERSRHVVKTGSSGLHSQGWRGQESLGVHTDRSWDGTKETGEDHQKGRPAVQTRHQVETPCQRLKLLSTQELCRFWFQTGVCCENKIWLFCTSVSARVDLR